MKTALILMTQYDGLAIVPVERVCRDYFTHLTPEKFLRKVLAGEIKLPVVDGGIEIIALARYIDERADIARQELREREEVRAKLSFKLDEALAEPAPRVTIYFIEAGAYVKIGMTAGDVRLRLSNLATSHYEQLRLLATIPDAPASMEFELHQRFAQDRVRGEWFVLSEEIRAYIEEVKG
jgi:hypothetical protein